MDASITHYCIEIKKLVKKLKIYPTKSLELEKNSSAKIFHQSEFKCLFIVKQTWLVNSLSLKTKAIISFVPCLLQSQQYDDENSCHVWWIGKNFIVPIIKWYLDSRADCSRWFILYFILVSPTQVCYVSEYRINASPSIN